MFQRFLKVIAVSISIIGLIAAGASSQKKLPPATDLGSGELHTIGEKPAGFEAFDDLYLSNIIITSRGTVVAKNPKGNVNSSEVNEARIRSITVTGRRIRFSTVSLKGIAYSFDGSFRASFQRDEHGALKGEVLRGTLIKLVNGTEAARAEVGFEFIYYSD